MEDSAIDPEMVAMARKLASFLAADPSRANSPALKPALASIWKTIETAEDVQTEADSCFPFCFPTGSGGGKGGPSFSAESLGSGCYLVHTEANNGTLSALWSETPVEVREADRGRWR